MDRLNTALYKQIFDEMNQLIMIFDTDQTVVTVNRAVLDLVGLGQDSFIGMHVSELPLFRDSADKSNEVVFRMGHCFSMEDSQRFEATHLDSLGNTHEIDYIMKPIKENDMAVFTMMMGYNITEMVQARKALTSRDKQIKAFFDNSDDGYFFFVTPEPAIVKGELSNQSINEIFSAQRLASINARMHEITGIETIDEKNILKAIGIEKSDVATIWRNMIVKGTVSVETAINHAVSNQRVFLGIRFIAIIDENGDFEGNFCIVQNITEQYLYQRELNFLANKDTLTGLNNRRNFRKLAYTLVESSEKTGDISVGMMDIDHFKNVNDTYGHDVGDLVISAVSEIIDNIDPTLITGRYGGEEFIVIGKHTKEEINEVCERIRMTVESRKISFGDGTLSVTISSGISAFESGDDDLQKIITQADKALYESKTCGRNRVTVYDEEILGRKAVDNLTGLLKKKAITYRMKQAHDDLRIYGRSYSVVEINLETLIVSEFAILDQYIKQTAGILQTLMRKGDAIGRVSNTKFLVVIKGADTASGEKAQKRIEQAMHNLSNKFDNLVSAEVKLYIQMDREAPFKNIIDAID